MQPHPTTAAKVAERAHGAALRALWMQPGQGVRAVVVDATLSASVYCPLDDSLLPLPEAVHAPGHCVWDAADANTFILTSGQVVHAFCIAPMTVNGPMVRSLGTTATPPATRPVVLVNGLLGCLARDGQLTLLVLPSHKPLQSGWQAPESPGADQQAARLAALLALGRLEEAQALCAQVGSPALWPELGRAALEHLDVARAVYAFREVGNAGTMQAQHTVWCRCSALLFGKYNIRRTIRRVVSPGMVLRLEPLLLVEDWHARAGMILAALEADPDAAESLLLRSRTPAAAVALRRDVQHWERALVLAQQLQPDMVGYLSCRRAQELEVAGSFDAALLHYEAALTAASPEDLGGLMTPAAAGALGVGGAREDAYVWACQAGKARCAVHEGAVDLVRACPPPCLLLCAWPAGAPCSTGCV